VSRQEPQDPTSVTGLLASTGLFDVLDESALKAVESALEPVGVASGEVLFRQGDIGDSLYVLIYGRLVIVVQGENGEDEIIGEIGRGEVVGEMAILTGAPRSATVRAIRDSELVKLSREAFERVVAANPLAMTLIARRILWSRINPFARAIDVPNIMAIMMRTMMIGSLHNTKVAARNADLYIRPPIEEFGLFEWRSMNQIVDAGYQFGLKKIDEWRSGRHTPAVASE